MKKSWREDTATETTQELFSSFTKLSLLLLSSLTTWWRRPHIIAVQSIESRDYVGTGCEGNNMAPIPCP